VIQSEFWLAMLPTALFSNLWNMEKWKMAVLWYGLLQKVKKNETHFHMQKVGASVPDPLTSTPLKNGERESSLRFQETKSKKT